MTIEITNEEALEICKKAYAMAVKKNKESCMNFSELDDVIGMGNMIKAVEKQIPQKIDLQFGMYVCPRCGYGQDEHKKFSYCHSCGQRLDWEGIK